MLATHKNRATYIWPVCCACVTKNQWTPSRFAVTDVESIHPTIRFVHESLPFASAHGHRPQLQRKCRYDCRKTEQIDGIVFPGHRWRPNAWWPPVTQRVGKIARRCCQIDASKLGPGHRWENFLWVIESVAARDIPRRPICNAAESPVHHVL